jgi:hypothetical protein
MMSASRLRTILRWSHLAEGVFLETYIYSPFHVDPTWTFVVR